MGRDIAQAWSKAYEADKVSIYGGIVAVNREVDAATALAMKPVFLEIIIAPSFSKEALEILTKKKNLRLLEVDMRRTGVRERQLVSVNGGLLVQDLDTETCTVTAEMAVTKRRPESGSACGYGISLGRNREACEVQCHLVVKTGVRQASARDR